MNLKISKYIKNAQIKSYANGEKVKYDIKVDCSDGENPYGCSNEVMKELKNIKLEDISKELESGKLDLDESVSKFEEGMKLSKICTKMLNEAEKRINILIDKDGEISEENFTPEE